MISMGERNGIGIKIDLIFYAAVVDICVQDVFLATFLHKSVLENQDLE